MSLHFPIHRCTCCEDDMNLQKWTRHFVIPLSWCAIELGFLGILRSINVYCSIFIRMATPLAFFRNAFLGIVELKPSGNRVRHIVSSQDDAVAGVMGR